MTTVKVHRWSVLARATDKAGHLTRTAESYKRTSAPQFEREEQVIRFVNRGRVTLSFGGVPIVASADFMLRSGRCVGNPDWVLLETELPALRKLARAAFPRKKKIKAPVAPVSVEEGKVAS
jgi:hypothetical protein